MKLPTKLHSPIALAVQGFLLGAALLFTLDPLAADERPAPAPTGSVLDGLQA